MIEKENNGILFVCLGNICRSPTVEAVVRAEFARAGLDVAVASCGTGDWHVGQGADPRAARAGAEAGYDLSLHCARQLRPDDFARHRMVLAMDRSNLADLQAMCPPGLRSRVGLFLEVAGVAPPSEVPDPYQGDAEDFARVITLARHGAQGLVELLRE
ncbi:MAG TPA: low molecular weight protein-tyrosine-phosphatase [Oleiagrimonas sp.]|nr:low molecular weight protein-tyrosine-phosphatase [Oleiagrimonas sp.]